MFFRVIIDWYIFQSDKPIGMIKAVRAIVHENASVDEAYEIYQSGPVGL